MSEFETDTKYIERQYQAHRNLWAARLSVMIEDLNQNVPVYNFTNNPPALRAKRRSKINQVKNRKEKVARWILDDKNTVASFVWICEVIDLCPKRVRRLLGLVK